LADYRWSSYRAYGYGDMAPKWLNDKVILSRFKSKAKHKAYREQVQRYAKEEKKLWEDFRHGMIIGSKNFVDKIRRVYLPEELHKEIPQQRDLARGIDLEAKLRAVAKKLGHDLDLFRQMPRITKSVRDDRDLLVLSVWKTGMLTNGEIGQLFGTTYSAVSHIVKSVRQRIDQDYRLKERFDNIFSLFKF
jgi:uncharacterized membrane-anchored protein YjiN (DUF445 family)